MSFADSDSVATPLTGFEELCPHWALFEHTGLNERVLAAIDCFRSPILLLGSGQGLVPQALQSLGHAVTSVDISRQMIAYARSRRNIETIHGDAASVSIGRRFRTVVVNTGVITQANVRSPFARAVVHNAAAHLTANGRVVLAYLKYSFSITVFEGLGLLGRPSSNFLVWEARESLDTMKDALASYGCDRALLESVFVLCRDDLERHRDLIARIGTADMKANQSAAPSRELLDRCADFETLYLKPDSEDLLLRTIAEDHAVVQTFEADNGTAIVVYGRK